MSLLLRRTVSRLARPQARRRAAWWLLVASIIGWPVSAFTVARGEPQVVLALSWLAITFTAADLLATTDVRAEVDQPEK